MLVLLDLWGVLLDSQKMEAAYPERLGSLLSDRCGGDAVAWRRAHDRAHAWYVEHMARPQTWSDRSWIEAVNAAEAEYVVRMFRDMRAALPDDPLGTSRSLELDVMSRMDAAYTDARPAVARLKAAGHRVCVATNATEPNARGSLAGARLLGEFDAVFTGELMNGGKERPEYWRTLLAREPAGPLAAVVVDDRLDYLKAAASAGLISLLLDREGSHRADAVPAFVRATLRNLAGLPHFVGVLADEHGR